MLKEIRALACGVRTQVRYDGTLPFRAAVNDRVAQVGGRMRNPKNRKRLGLTRKAAWQHPVAVVAAVLIGTSAYADGLDTAYSLAMQPYAVLKRTSIACGKPIEEHVAYKQRMLAILGGVPGIDILAASRAIEKAYQTDADLGGLECTDGLQDRYKQIIDRGVDRDLEYLAEEVRNRQHGYR